MLQNQLFELALNFHDPWFISKIEFKAEQKRLDIHIDFKKGSLFHYHSEEDNIDGDFKAYDTQTKKWRHLNFFEHECYLHARVPRVKTDDNKIRLIKPPWSGISNGFTLLFEALILQLSAHMPVHTVAKITKVHDYKIWKMLKHYVDKALADNDYSQLQSIGIDETSQRKRHKYITLFVDLDQKRTIFITEGKNHETVEAFAKDLKSHNIEPKQIEDISCDMSPAFIKGIKNEFKNANITFDKFHIMKVINNAVNTVRKNEVKSQEVLKGHKYIFLKNEANLTKKQKSVLESLKLSKLNLKSVRALHLRENFQEIYKAESSEEFEHLLKKWYFWATHGRIEPITQAAYTIRRHWYGVLQWYESKINNGLLEGLNSIIQAAKAKARGFRNAEYFKIIAFLITGNLDFSKYNKNYLPT